MRRSAICLAMLFVAGAASVAAQGARTRGEKVSPTDRARAVKPAAKAATASPAALAQDRDPGSRKVRNSDQALVITIAIEPGVAPRPPLS